MSFSVEPHSQTVPKPWGHEIIMTAPGSPRVGKLLFVMAGKRLSFQYHDEKEETLCLISGKALLWLEDGDGTVRKIPMVPHAGYAVAPMQRHRVEAVEDAVVAEVSAPETGNTVRIEDDYARKDETEAVRAEEGRGWKN
jgi:mannose-6-phosphate isomerase